MGHRFILTGGGTGGHVTPAIALGEELRAREPDAQFLYVGTRTGKEAEIVPRYGFPIAYVQSHQWSFRRKWHVLRFIWRIACGTIKACHLIIKYRPDAVIGTGGYVAAPVVFANVLLRRIRLSRALTIIHEQNTVPGKLNALVGKVADLVLLSFPTASARFPRAVCVGYPVRPEIAPADRTEAKRRLGIPQETTVVLAFGGSMGARTINRAVVDALPFLRDRKDLHIVHGTGRKLSSYDPVADCESRMQRNGLTYESLSGWYEAHGFIDRIGEYYAAADVVVCRSGAGTLAELCACGRAALLIPKANLPGDHQVLNALEMARRGAADILFEDAVTTNGAPEEYVAGEELARKIVELLEDKPRLGKMESNALASARPEATKVSVGVILSLLEGRSPDGLLLEFAAREPVVGDAHLDTRFGRVAALSGEALRAYAETAVSRICRSLNCASGTPSDQEDALVRALDADEMVAYLRYRAATHLTSKNWRMRNAGVKMVGILRQRDKLPVLAGFVKDRAPASRMRRLFGGDFETNGFIRRNSMASLIRLGVASPLMREVILCGLEDPYFEVRSQAARAVQAFRASLENDQEIVERLLNCAKDKYFEVAVEAVKAMGSVASAETALEVFRSLSQHENWRVRQAVVEACCALLDRGQDVPKAFLSEILAGMMVTSTGFCPSFSLKLAVAKLGERIREPDSTADDRGKL